MRYAERLDEPRVDADRHLDSVASSPLAPTTPITRCIRNVSSLAPTAPSNHQSQELAHSHSPLHHAPIRVMDVRRDATSASTHQGGIVMAKKEASEPTAGSRATATADLRRRVSPATRRHELCEPK